MAVVATSYRPDARWEPRELSRGESAMALLSNTVPAQSRPRQTMRYLTRAVSEAVGYESPRGDAAELAPQLLALLER